jgi:hypothetical protein
MRKYLITAICLLSLFGCDNNILEKITHSQYKYFKQNNDNQIPGNMLESIELARKNLFKSKLKSYDEVSDTLFLIEGFSDETGKTYSVVWSKTFNPINFKTDFGKDLVLIDQNLFSDKIISLVSVLNFDSLKRKTTVLGGNLYIASVVTIKDKKVESIKHKIFEEPSF